MIHKILLITLIDNFLWQFTTWKSECYDVLVFKVHDDKNLQHNSDMDVPFIGKKKNCGQWLELFLQNFQKFNFGTYFLTNLNS